MKTEVPCYGCDNRTETCHSSCQLYIDWSTKRAEERETRIGSPNNEILRYESLRRYKLNKMKRYK